MLTVVRDLPAALPGQRPNEWAFSRVRVQLRSSYSHHYRRGLPKLTFRCNNIAHKPVVDALGLLERYADSAEKFYAVAETVADRSCGSR